MFKSKYFKTLTASLVLASGLFMTSSATLAAKNFTDLNSEPSHVEGVTYLNNLDIFDYKTGSKLNGKAGVTRAEVSKILHNLYNDEIPPVRAYKNNLKDVNSKTPFYNDVIWAYESGIFDGDSNGNFNANQTLTRAQMAKVLVNTFLLDTTGKSNFKDVPTNHWSYEYINILGAEGISIGSGGNYMPNDKVTLSQLSTFIHRIITKYSATKPEAPAVQEEEKHEVVTFEEVKQIALDLYNSDENDKVITVYTKEDVSDKFTEYEFLSRDFSQVAQGYAYYGRSITVGTREFKNGLYETEIMVDDRRDAEDRKIWEQKVENGVAYIKANYNTSTDYDIVKSVNKFLASQMTYGQSIKKDHPYLERGGSMCMEYADAMATYLTAFGIENRTLGGVMTDGEGHSWNAVKLNGNWYHTDATAYDSDSEKNMEKYLVMTQSELDKYMTKQYSDFRATSVPFNK